MGMRDLIFFHVSPKRAPFEERIAGLMAYEYFRTFEDGLLQNVIAIWSPHLGGRK